MWVIGPTSACNVRLSKLCVILHSLYDSFFVQTREPSPRTFRAVAKGLWEPRCRLYLKERSRKRHQTAIFFNGRVLCKELRGSHSLTGRVPGVHISIPGRWWLVMLGQVPPPGNEVEQVTEVEVSDSHALQGGLVFLFLVAAAFSGAHCGAITLAAASGIRPESIAPVKKKKIPFAQLGCQLLLPPLRLSDAQSGVRPCCRHPDFFHLFLKTKRRSLNATIF